MHPYEIEQALDGERGRRARLVAELDGLQARVRTSTASDGTHERILNVRSGLEKADRRVEDLEDELAATEARHAALERVAQNPRHHEGGDGAVSEPDDARGRPRTPTRVEPPQLGRARDDALRTIERHARTGTLTPDAADSLDDIVRRRDPLGLDARYLDAVGSDEYATAFGKLLRDPAQGHLRFGPEEVEAVRRVTEATEARAMVEGTGSAGGFALPIQIDPSIQLSSSGALNPIRDVARVIQMSTREWRGVTSDGVVAEYAPEAAEVADASPTLAQPTIVAARGDAFISFSIELDQDWASLQAELLRLISDARDVLDAEKFLTGSGNDEPAGILTGLTTSQRVQTATTATYALGDVYALKQAVPPRFQARLSYLASPQTVDATYRFVGGGSAEPPVVSPDRASILGRPLRELSTMTSATTTGSKIAVAGDFQAGFTIADRLGMQAEVIQNLLHTANNRPYGVRGLVVYWRSGSKVVVPNALRYLEVK